MKTPSLEPSPEQRGKDTLAMFEALAKAGGGPTSPMQVQYGTGDKGEPFVWFSVGLTKREHIAAMMMQGFLAAGSMLGLSEDGRTTLSNQSVNCADALLERLKT